MAIYEYECTMCGERTQRLQRQGEDSTGRMCLTCRTGVIRKVFWTYLIPGPDGRWCAPPERSRFR